MPDYKTMYGKLFNKITDVVNMLQEIQQEVEEMYIESGEKEDQRIHNLKVLEHKEKKH